MFREKRVGKEKKVNVVNLDLEHHNMVRTFDSHDANIPTKHDKITKLESEIEKISRNTIKSLSELDRLRNLRAELNQLNEGLEETTKKLEEVEYYMSTHELLQEYYENTDDSMKKNTISMEDFYNLSDLGGESQTQKLILDKYMSIIKPETVICGTKQRSIVCEDCSVVMLEGSSKNWYCPKCGQVQETLLEVDTVAPQTKYPYYNEHTKASVYQRVNHFKEWLKQIQAKENTEIPESVIDGVQAELKKMRISPEDVTHSKVRAILKKINMARYYENIVYIIHRISGVPPPTITFESEQELVRLFKQIEEPFQQYKDKERKNILRYSYILCKLCELLELDEILHCFKLLKNRDKLIRQDVLWKQICVHNRWQFIPSV